MVVDICRSSLHLVDNYSKLKDLPNFDKKLLNLIRFAIFTLLLWTSNDGMDNTPQGRPQGGFGVKTPAWAWYLTKTLLPAHTSLIVFAYFLLVNLSPYCKYHGNNLHANFKEQCKWAKKKIRFWWESGLSSASRNHVTTFCRPFVHYACLRLCSAIAHFIRNNCLYFVFYGWSAQALTALTTLPISVAW